MKKDLGGLISGTPSKTYLIKLSTTLFEAKIWVNLRITKQ